MNHATVDVVTTSIPLEVLYPSKAAWNCALAETKNVRDMTGWYLPAGVGQTHELAMAVVTQLGPEFPAKRLLCLHNTKTTSGDLEHLVRLAVWSAKKDVPSAGDTKCNACGHFFVCDMYAEDGFRGGTGCEVEGLCTHCLVRCTCADAREHNEETCYCTDGISQHDAFLRGFGGPAKAKEPYSPTLVQKRKAETGPEPSPRKPRSG